jgi:hypothetical protein
MENNLTDHLKNLPAILRDKDLIEFGFFTSTSACSRARRNKISPPFIKLHNKSIAYLKADVLTWAKRHYYTNTKTDLPKINDLIPAKEDSFLSITDEFPPVTEYHAVCPHTLKEGYENNHMLTKDCYKENAPDDCRYCGTLINFEKGDN